ncbi:uncharacterized protein LOC134696833 [Mytilus trossulus]|uniref:uncharacterized protein LOC134696833 n=1 Tax=Mytilus trossulus TaxID=6551 RepID=UPI00300741C6
MHSTSTETVTTADMTSTNASKEPTIATTSTELGTTTVVESITTSPDIPLLPTSTEMDRSTETTTKEKTAVHSSVASSETTHLTTIQFTSKDTDITMELKDETTIDNLFTDTEQLKRYSGPIILAGLGICGFVLVIIVFVLLKVVKGRSMIDTERIENKKEQDAYVFTPETCYIYKGKHFGFQKIAIQNWDNH